MFGSGSINKLYNTSKLKGSHTGTKSTYKSKKKSQATLFTVQPKDNMRKNTITAKHPKNVTHTKNDRFYFNNRQWRLNKTFFDQKNIAVGVLLDRIIEFEIHDTTGDGQCGVHAMPVPNAKTLYQNLTGYLQNNERDVKYGRVLTCLGNEIMNGLAGGRVVLSKNLQNKLSDLLHKWQSSQNEQAREQYAKICKDKNTCLDYINYDLKKNHCLLYLQLWMDKIPTLEK